MSKRKKNQEEPTWLLPLVVVAGLGTAIYFVGKEGKRAGKKSVK